VIGNRILPALLVPLLGLAGCATLPQEELRARNTTRDLAWARTRAPAPSAPLTLDAALAYALENSLAIWSARQEQAIQEEARTRARLGMLPSLILDAEASERSRAPANRSENLLTEEVSDDATFSADKTARQMHVTALWNLLDFGIAYLRAQQEADRVRMAAERLARARETLGLDVTGAYWRAAATRETAQVADEIEAAIGKVLVSVRAAVAENAISAVEGLAREAPLLEYQLRVRQTREDEASARAELAALLGVPPGESVELAEVRFDQPPAAQAEDVHALEAEALEKRPELRERDLEERVSLVEARAALARMFPSPAAFLRYDTDRNRFLYDRDWYTAGLRASWDLLNLPQRLHERRAAAKQADLVACRRTALTIGVLTQLHLALVDRDREQRQFELIQRISAQRAQLAEAAAQAARDGKGHAGDMIEAQMKHFVAHARYVKTYANLQTAHARILHSVGRAPAGPDVLNPLPPSALPPPEPETVSARAHPYAVRAGREAARRAEKADAQ